MECKSELESELECESRVVVSLSPSLSKFELECKSS